MLQSLFIDPSYQGLFGNPLPQLLERTQQIPGSVRYFIRRYQRQGDWSEPDEGLLVYQYEPQDPDRSNLELHFLLTGEMPSPETGKGFDRTDPPAWDKAAEKIDSVDLISFRYTAQYLRQWARSRGKERGFIDDIIGFKHTESFRRPIPLSGEVIGSLQRVLNHSYRENRENIFINAQSQMLLLQAFDAIERPAETELPAFLSHPSERLKIEQAREWLIQHIGEPLTIKELSRKVAINECYLKKGFRALYGTTIFDFYQSQRMEHARYLLYEREMSVTEVSVQLGYSSISHFSTAFKKYTGINPGDLLYQEEPVEVQEN